jgi:hypothetical protein
MSQVMRKGEKTAKKKVYFTGTDTLYAGYHLCYDADAVRAAETNVAITAANDSAKTAANEYIERANRVEKPSTTNLRHYAGAVVEEYDGKVGPCSIEIYVPVSRGQKVMIRTEESCTIDQTVLSLKAGSYDAGGEGEGPAIALACQTVDRSSTSGLVQALLVGPEHAHVLNGSVAGAAGQSPLIWDGVPWEKLISGANPGLGFAYFRDYLDEIDVTTADGYVITQSNSTGLIRGLATDQGGVLQVDSDGSTADDSVNVQLTNCAVLPAAGVKICFEARVNMNDATQQYFLGLCEVNTAILASGAVEDTDDKVGFLHVAADTDNKISSVTARAAADDITADVADNVDNTYMTVGFVIDGITTVTFYVNGVAVESGALTANTPNKLMVLSMFAGYESAAALMDIDWVKLCQIGGRA